MPSPAEPAVDSSASPARVVVLSGGVGGARFLTGVRRWADLQRQHRAPSSDGSGPQVTAVVNTADDLWLHGLKVCPDLDTVMYTLGGGIDTHRGWGRTEETWHAKEELAAYGVGPDWFGLGDRDLATHLVRTQMLEAGYGLADVTAALCRRWDPGMTLLPMSEDRIETHVVIDEPETDAQRAVHLQEYWVRYRAEAKAHRILQIGIDEATPGPGVLAAIAAADLILIAPSNPVVSVDPILTVPGIRESIRAAAAPVIGVSGIIGDAPVLGMARQVLGVVGVDCDPVGVAGYYGARNSGGVLDGWLIADTDAALLPAVTALGIRSAAAPLLMTDPDATADIVAAAVELRHE